MAVTSQILHLQQTSLMQLLLHLLQLLLLQQQGVVLFLEMNTPSEPTLPNL
jgi:uncharacterized membrane protein YesL